MTTLAWFKLSDTAVNINRSDQLIWKNGRSRKAANDLKLQHCAHNEHGNVYEFSAKKIYNLPIFNSFHDGSAEGRRILPATDVHDLNDDSAALRWLFLFPPARVRLLFLAIGECHY